jgi:sialate O-acetylesterase
VDALYARLFPAMISDWREGWGEGNFPFLFVQISAYGLATSSPWSVVREAQRRTLSVANIAMVVSADVGDPKNIHPLKVALTNEETIRGFLIHRN